ncbi:disks large-associated protein 5 [Chanos chanos]|uniref:Disks large-associated protein 5 n=1 Tax=Chanos chanos TaxID=29144 RepID=A0A6J2VGE2_CHACN|nr:disks large-associated protein 5-like [Chanos chanos]
MESRFAHLYQRDSSVAMLRVKMSRRRSQTQKENRERLQNIRRNLDGLPELDVSQDISVIEKSVISVKEVPLKATKDQTNSAAEERKKMLARYKEAKALQREKEKRAKEKKGGVFKVGLYKPQPLGYLPSNSLASGKPKPAEAEGAAAACPTSDETKRSEEAKSPENPVTSSFAPRDFVFSAPLGLSTFKPTPLSPRSADAFLSPSFSFEPKMDHRSPSPTPPLSSQPSTPPPASSPPSLTDRGTVSSVPPTVSSPQPSPAPPAPSPPSVPEEPQHDVPYFRAVVVSETERLTELSEQWEARFDDTSIPEEMRDRMRTAVGQARLLMKERFGQFSGLVDDCDFGRGEKITTCTDLQGFWDMVYFQVEDVNRKFNALKEAEARGWQEESRAPVRQKRVVKKPPAAGGKSGAGASTAAKSRLAAVKAAMKAKAKQAAAEKPPDVPVDSQNNPTAAAPVAEAPANTLTAPTIVFHGGFFQVESPVKLAGPVRRSSRLNAAPSPHSSPCLSKFSTPGRQVRSVAVSRASPFPCKTPTPAPKQQSDPETTCTPHRPADTALCSSKTPQTSNDQTAALCLSPERVSQTLAFPQSHSDLHCNTDDNQSGLGIVTTANPIDQQDCSNHDSENTPSPTEIQPQDSPSETERVQPPCSPDQLEGSTQLEGCNTELVSATPSCQERPEEAMASETSLVHSPAQRADIAPAPVHAMSFTLSPCTSHTSPSQTVTSDLTVNTLSSPCLMVTTPPRVSIQPPVSSNDGSSTGEDVEMSGSPDTSCNEDMPGLDFERYLQKTARCSTSPGETVATETFSPMATDEEMRSPEEQQGAQIPDVPETPTALPSLGPLVFTPRSEKPRDSDLWLFTPEPRDRVRQSVCERDLMMFTPPSNK